MSNAATQTQPQPQVLLVDAITGDGIAEAILRGYQEMAADEQAEREAFEWIEAGLGEAA